MTLTAPLLYLTAADVQRALPMRDAIAAMRDAFVQLSSGQVNCPPRQRLPAADAGGAALVMSCHSAVSRLFALKFITLFAANRDKGLPLIQSSVMLADGTTGQPLAVMDGAAVTAIRTGAAAGLATDVLARPDAAVVAIFGAGVQARTQLEAVCTVRAIRQAFVYDPNAAAAERYAGEMTERLRRPVVRAGSPREALADAGVVCTATTAAVPVFADDDVPPGVHINAVGSYRPEVSEIPAATVCRARIVVDHFASAREEAGDLLGPLSRGDLDETRFATELGAVLLGSAPGRCSTDEITFFKSVGVAIQDLCAAASALENARRLGLGTLLPQ